MTSMVLEVWPSDFILPSVDYRCLQFMACARMCASPVKIMKEAKPWRSPTGELPVFREGQGIAFTDYHRFTNHLRTQIPELALDGHLNLGQQMELRSYEALLEEKLRPAYQYTLWMDNANFNCITNRWYAEQLPFGYGMYYTQKIRRKVEAYLQEVCPGSLVKSEDIAFQVTKEGLQCINLLSAKLNDKKYFFGDRPTSLDALVFGYLAPLLKMPLPNDKIQQHIKACPNLTRFVDSIINVYLPLHEEELSEQRATQEKWEDRRRKAKEEMAAKDRDKTQDGDPEYSTRDIVIFAIAAITLSLTFALSMGIIQVTVVEKNEDEEHNYSVQ